MEKFVVWLGVIVLFLFVVALGGIIIFLLWPVVIPAVFPGLVENGDIARNINFWTSLGLSFLCSALFKSSRSSSSSKK